MSLTRRTALLATLAPLPLLAARDAFAELEARAGGRLGAAVLNTATGASWAHRGDERFGLCSTFKLPLAAATLAQVDAGRWRLDDRLPLAATDPVGHSPITRARLAEGGITVEHLAQAAQVHSDNGAANLLLRHLGGPQPLTQWLRERGDAVTRIDRYEPEMNRVPPGEVRDTTSPSAMAATVARICTGSALQPASRERLLAWMQATETGLRRLRAGLPKGWRAGDKTGTGFDAGMPDRINDVMVFWPPQRPPLVVACYYEGPQRSNQWVRPQDEAVVAEVGRLVAAWALKGS